MHTVAEIKAHFAAGAETVTLTKAEWDALCEVIRIYSASGRERRAALEEAERIKRIARPVWRACMHVTERMQRSMQHAVPAIRIDLVAEWEMQLRRATTVDLRDLPKGHPGRSRRDLG